jgi:phosphoribosylamine--glycine ligase
VVLPRWASDIAATFASAAEGRLSDADAPTFSRDSAVCVVLASPGYPESPRVGARIEGLAQARAVPGATVYSAGVASGPEGQDLVTAGGRVLGVVGNGPDLASARQIAYRATGLVSWPDMVYRSDIADIAAGAEQ